MNKITNLCAGLALSFAVAGCGMMKKSPAAAAGGGESAKTGLGDTMADAVVYQRGATISAAALCHTSGYAKLTIPAGEAIKLEVTVTSPTAEEACISVGFLKENGGDGGLSAEACSTKSPLTYDVTAQEGASFLQISENGVCQTATFTVAIK